jgi:hypothetical protein
VTQLDGALPDQVVIQCPACGAAESTDPAVLVDAPMIVCRNCGETWPAQPRRTRRRGLPGIKLPEPLDPHAVEEAERMPLVTYSDGADKAWARKMEGDILPDEPPESPRRAIASAGFVAALFIAAFFVCRDAAVTVLPDLAGLYRAVGLPVNVQGLAIEALVAERETAEAASRLKIRGAIRNLQSREAAVPPLAVSLLGTGSGAAPHGFDPPQKILAPGASMDFELELDDVPPAAKAVVVRFRRPAEHVTLAEGAVAPRS